MIVIATNQTDGELMQSLIDIQEAEEPRRKRLTNDPPRYLNPHALDQMTDEEIADLPQRGE